MTNHSVYFSCLLILLSDLLDPQAGFYWFVIEQSQSLLQVILNRKQGTGNTRCTAPEGVKLFLTGTSLCLFNSSQRQTYDVWFCCCNSSSSVTVAFSSVISSVELY